MSHYELVLVLNPSLDDAAIAATLEKVSGWIAGGGGNISAQEQWGRKKLSYPIARQNEGYFALTRFEGKPALSRQVEGNLKLAEEVLRHLLVKVEGTANGGG